jgi:hypothetical protein
MFDGRTFTFVVSGPEKDRLESIVARGEKQFLIFDAKEKRVALNGQKVAACNIMFDVGVVNSTVEEEATCAVTVHFISSQNPAKFGVEPDTVAAERDESGFDSQLQDLFFFLDSIGSDDVLWFDDEDGGRVYIQASHVLLFEAPLICCEPDLLENSLDNFDEEIPEASELSTDQKS